MSVYNNAPINCCNGNVFVGNQSFGDNANFSTNGPRQQRQTDPDIPWPGNTVIRFDAQHIGSLDIGASGNISEGSVDVYWSNDERYGSLDIKVYASDKKFLRKLQPHTNTNSGTLTYNLELPRTRILLNVSRWYTRSGSRPIGSASTPLK